MHNDQNKELAKFKIERKSGDKKKTCYNTESRLNDRDVKRKKKENHKS